MRLSLEKHNVRSILEKREKKSQEKGERPRKLRFLYSKVRVGLTFNNLESMILKIVFNML
ncbi:hypothetical protein MTR_7g058720 [Medicago truncatula]|uniref:Uncharacterized protein n=1 Tax=Medicago truncatula TaxID=3880 RepID=G7L1B2_MEDTR|nr:hypothetical protein MTR_7g058720 [Medicago truncatula]